VTVRAVAPGGPAEKAGIKANDILVKANDRPLRTYLDWEAVKLDLKVGDPINVTVKSAGTTSERRIITGDLPTLNAARVRVLQGLDLVTVTPAIRAERNVRNENGGALVVKIPSDISTDTGILQNDVIYGIDQRPIKTADEVARAIGAVPAGQAFRLWIERSGQGFPITLRKNP